MKRLAFGVAAVSLLAAGVAKAATCGPDSQCPKDSPCCSAEGNCGRGSMQCAGGCQPMYSYSASSCLPLPMCKSMNLNITSSDFNNTDLFTPILDYNGNSSMSPFTLDSGILGAGPEGVQLEMTIDRQSKISTTNYMLYGVVKATLRHEARQGLVATMITMSPVKDEIDWEFTTANSNEALTNYFEMGKAVTTNGATITPGNGFDVSDWHEYGLDWSADRLNWLIDGNIVRTVTRQQAGNSYPRSPMQIQFSTWAGGNATNPPGTIEWAGGPITFPDDGKGYLYQEMKSYSIACRTPSSSGGSSNATSWVYTGQQDQSTGEPEFIVSSEPIKLLSQPGTDGLPGYPGYDTDPGPGTGPGTSRWDGSGTSKSSSSDEDSDVKAKAIKYGLPVAGALIAIIALWALVTLLYRRRQKNKMYASGVTGIAGGPGMTHDLGGSRGKLATATGLYAVTASDSSNGLGRKGSKYIPLQDVADAGLPDGAKRSGTGIGPAVGPTPSKPLMYREYSDDGYQTHRNVPGGGRQYEDAAWKSTDSFDEPSYGAWPDKPTPYGYPQQHSQHQQQQPAYHPQQYAAPQQHYRGPPQSSMPPPAQQQQQQYSSYPQQRPQQQQYGYPQTQYPTSTPQPRHYDTPNVGYYSTPQVQARSQYPGQPYNPNGHR